MKKVMLVFGTRPEAIKMAPLVKEFQKYPEEFQTIVCVTGQHREMLDQVLRIFDIVPDYDLDIMKQGQSLYDITDRVLLGLKDVLEKEKPEHFAVRQYKKYKLAAGKTAKSILISCGARLAPFDIAELRELTSYDELELDMLGDQRTAMFVIISDTDDTFNFLVAIMYTQLFNLLCDRADDVHGGRLPYHVRLLLDEFANIGQIPKFDKLIATIRSREISASIILQSQSQLKTIYKDAAETILGNCDTMLFLGGKEGSTLKEISETLGK